MNCTLIQLDSGHWHCSECGYTSISTSEIMPSKLCIRPTSIIGIGTCMRKIISRLHVQQSQGCGCSELEWELNKLTPQEVLDNRSVYEQKLRDNFTKLDWTTLVMASVEVVVGGTVLEAAKYCSPNWPGVLLDESVKQYTSQ